jgi:hypothetical protein
MDDITIKAIRAASEPRTLAEKASTAEPRAWEQIEIGRYQPKRIKGSCLGRELG